MAHTSPVSIGSQETKYRIGFVDKRQEKQPEKFFIKSILVYFSVCL